ncbi:ComEC/Rec2 family competence protein [Paenibacillus sp. ACRRX]|uniref:ComEC/Rec2 family competence protein n=1 Tax=Paenibacillus sp. ACRRX TaxID=2918206 RepID=UPI001EF71907|nr:ComEC/Rec2 family competence protein [Paenibacillus sp. ACRRX]MCG7407892.1 ComEC/Rec2 family competence protein [Paenibacillus sp. ACRRX]
MFMQRPIVIFACCWVLGIHLAAALPVQQAAIAIAGLILCIPVMVKLRLLRLSYASVYALALIAALVSFIWYDTQQITSIPIERELLPGEHISGALYGVIGSPIERDGDKIQFRLRADKWLPDQEPEINLDSEWILVTLLLKQEQEIQQAQQWRQAEYIKITGQLMRPGEADNFGAFNYRQYLKNEHIYWLFQGKGVSSVQVIRKIQLWSIDAAKGKVEELRKYGASLYDRMLPNDQSTYMQGLVLGLRSDLDVDIEQSFAQLGLTHILAISGLHVAVFVGTCMLLLKRMRLTKERSLTVVIMLIPAYVLFTGASPSVIRAGLMSMLALIGIRQGWMRDGLHLLCISLLLMLWWEPYYALNVSFQLSYAVTAGLIIGVPPVMKVLPVSWPVWLRSSLTVTVVAQLMSFPLTVYYFNQVSLLSLFANFLFVPFISLIVLPLGTLTLVIAAISDTIAQPFVWLLSQFNQWTFGMVKIVADIEGAIMIWPRPPVWWIAVYYICLLFMLKAMHQLAANRAERAFRHQVDDTVPLEGFHTIPRSADRPIWIRFNVVLCAFVLLWIHGYHVGQPESTTISFIDIGQGDSILIRTAGGSNVLVDGGGTISFAKPGEQWKQRRKPYEVGKSRLVPLLKQRGIRHLDAVILTHGDTDHAGGLHAVLEHVPVDRLIMNGTWKRSSTMEQLYHLAHNRHIPVVSWRAGDQWVLDDETRLDVLYPIQDLNNGIALLDDQNDASLVMLLSMMSGEQKATLLLTGDIGAKGELDMLDEWRSAGKGMASARERLDMLKVAHHGSKTSTSEDWVSYWRPKAGVISAGRNNRYGHPHDQVLRTLQEAGSSIYRTDLQGEVQVVMTDQGLKVRVKRDRIAQ